MSFHKQTFHKDTFHQGSQITHDMLHELEISKIRGFPFFAYTGIKDVYEYYDLAKDLHELWLEHIPKNPKGIKNIKLQYDPSNDSTTILFFTKKGFHTVKEVYVGQLAHIIVGEMGVT